MLLFTIVYEVGDDVKQESCFGVDKFNARVKELQAQGFTILDVIKEEV